MSLEQKHHKSTSCFVVLFSPWFGEARISSKEILSVCYQACYTSHGTHFCFFWCSNTTHWQDAFLSVMRSFINLGYFSCQSKELASTNNTRIHQAISYSVIPLTLNFSSDKNCLLICIPCVACATAEFVWSNTMLSHLDAMARPTAHA